MIADIWTMMWKEYREGMRQYGGEKSTALRFLMVMVTMGVVLPWQAGKTWVTTPVTLGFWVLSPVLLAIPMIADSFAGERERHTLETLFASRLSDQAILFGKIGAIVSQSWIVAQMVMLFTLIPVNIRFWEGTFLFFRMDVLISGLGLSLLLVSIISTIGVLISIRASSVKQANQTMGLAIFVLAYGPLIALQILPENWKTNLGKSLRMFMESGAGLKQFTCIIAIVLVVINVISLLVVNLRFKRSELVLKKS